MPPPRSSPLSIMLILLSIAAVVGGLAIVAVTSPQSLDLSRFLPFLQATAAPTVTPGPTATPSATLTPPPATDTPVAPNTAPPLVTSTPTNTEPPPTPGGPTRTPTATRIVLPTDVRALAVITDKVGTLTARVRDVPDGAQVIAALPAGTGVQVLFGSQIVNGVEWVQVRLNRGRVGWVARFLLVFVVERPPGTLTPATPGPTQPQPTSVPNTQAPANTQGPQNTAPPPASDTPVPASSTPTNTVPPPPPTATASPTEKPTETLVPTETASPTEAATATETPTNETPVP